MLDSHTITSAATISPYSIRGTESWSGPVTSAVKCKQYKTMMLHIERNWRQHQGGIDACLGLFFADDICMGWGSSAVISAKVLHCYESDLCGNRECD